MKTPYTCPDSPSSAAPDHGASWRLRSVALWPVVVLSGTAIAQTADTSPAGGELTELVISATRRDESLSKVPLSVVATDQQTLDKQGVRNIGDLTRLTPGVTFAQNAQLPGLTNITIRGIQSTSGIPTTGIYIDDTPIQIRTGESADLSNPYPQIFDLDRVEVLRGPQGTLFGTGSVGGAIRFITPEPSLTDSSLYGRAESGVTEHGGVSYEAGLAGGAPIIENKLGFRVSVWHRHEGGYIERLDRVTKESVANDIDHLDAYAVRAALGWKPTDTLTLTPSIFAQSTDAQDLGIYETATSAPADARFRNGLTKRPQIYKDKYTLPALKAELDVGRATVFSNTSYLNRNIRSVSDDSPTNFALFSGYMGPLFPADVSTYDAHTSGSPSQRVFTQEFRVQNNDSTSRLTWVAGVFYSNSHVLDQFDAPDPQVLTAINYLLPPDQQFASVADFFNGVGLYNGTSIAHERTRYKDVQSSVFGQADYKLTDKLKATAGVRYTRSTVSIDTFHAGPLYETDGEAAHLDAKVTPITPKFGLSYQADNDNLFYANAAKGVRAPGVAPAVGISCQADADAIGFDPLQARKIAADSVRSYELGTKNKFFDERLILDASVYRINWSNVQTTLQLPGCQISTTLNLGDARSQGFDLAVGTAPLAGLQLGASVSYSDAHYTTAVYGPNDTVIRKANEPLDVAPWSFYLNGDYEFAVADYRAYLRADWTHTTHDSKPLDTDSPLVDPDLPRRAATSNLDLRAGTRLNGFDLSVFVNNALNDHPVLALFHDLPGAGNFRAVSTRPRTIGLTITVRK